MFPNTRVDKAILTPLIYKHQNITSTLVFILAFGIHCKFFIVLPIWLKICFLLFLQGSMCVSEVLRAQARLIGIRHAICPGLNNSDNNSFSVWHHQKNDLFFTIWFLFWNVCRIYQSNRLINFLKFFWIMFFWWVIYSCLIYIYL